MPAPTTTVLGLGPMGAPIARSLLRAGVPTAVWNRTASRTAPLAALGARVAEDLAAAGAPVILSVLPDVAQLRSLFSTEVLAAWGRADAVLVILSTTSPGAIRDLAEELRPHGIRVVDAPMSGGTAGAEKAELSLMIGGSEEDVAAVLPILQVIGTTLEHFGALGTGALAKLCNQIVVAGTLTSLGEALGLARAGGLDAAQLVRVLEGGLARSEVLAQKRGKLLEREYSLGGSTVNQLKDLRYAAQAMQDLAVPGELLPVLRQIFEELVAGGLGEADHSVVQERTAPPR